MAGTDKKAETGSKAVSGSKAASGSKAETGNEAASGSKAASGTESEAGSSSKKRRKKRRLKKGIKWTLLAILALILIIAAVILIPNISKVAKLANSAKRKAAASTEYTFREDKTTVCYDTDGNLLCNLKSNKDMYYVEFDEIPTTLVNAFIVMEDRDFYTHSGVDFKAVVRALIANMRNESIVQGASTITQQLARNIFLDQSVTYERKIEEMYLASELEKRYSKEQILEFYLNNIYFGNGYYGVEAAAEGYFNKKVSELSVAEQVFLSAIPNNPSKYDPVNKFENTDARKQLILEELKENGYIAGYDYNKAMAETIELNRKPALEKNSSVETYVRFCATEAMMEYAGFSFRSNFYTDADYESYEELYDYYYTQAQTKLYGGGYTIYTSIDMTLQAELEESVDSNLSAYTETYDEGIYSLQAAATCVDNATGNVVAIVGGRSQEMEGYGLNRAYQSYRQPGSAIKPLLVYTPFLMKGNTIKRWQRRLSLTESQRLRRTVQ